MTAYLTVAEFKLRTVMAQSNVDALELNEPGFLDAQLAGWTDQINARLRKRYAVPFASPVPPVVLEWLVRLVTPRAFLKLGVNPSDEQMTAIFKDAEMALAELKEAADAEMGLFDLPLRADRSASGITGGTLAYSEQSPYTWMGRQATGGRSEDGNA